MNWKWVELHCPHCGFAHTFKRICYWDDLEGIYIGLYGSDDMKSRKDCQKELVYGESTYDKLAPYLNGKVLDGKVIPS